MSFRFQPWVLAVMIVPACALVVGLVHWRTAQRSPDAAWMLQILPENRSLHLFVDFEALREAGFLDVVAAPAPPEDPDYTRFVQDTGFDYRTDLRSVAAAFTEGQVYLAVRGFFEWEQLSAYARAQGGQCLNSVCEMPGSRPGRNISFLPLTNDVLALAISSKPREVTALTPHRWQTPPESFLAPLWISAPGAVLGQFSSLPAGSQSFLSPLGETQRSTFTVGPSSQSGFNGFELRMDALFRTPAAAGDIERQLTGVTELLRSMLTRDKLKPNPADLSGVLASGRFQTHGERLTGVWDIDRRFVDALISGKLR